MATSSEAEPQVSQKRQKTELRKAGPFTSVSQSTFSTRTSSQHAAPHPGADDDSVLAKAREIKNFVKQQKKAMHLRSAKQSWLIVHQQLLQDRSEAEQVLRHAVEDMLDDFQEKGKKHAHDRVPHKDKEYWLLLKEILDALDESESSVRKQRRVLANCNQKMRKMVKGETVHTESDSAGAVCIWDKVDEGGGGGGGGGGDEAGGDCQEQDQEMLELTPGGDEHKQESHNRPRAGKALGLVLSSMAAEWEEAIRAFDDQIDVLSREIRTLCSSFLPLNLGGADMKGPTNLPKNLHAPSNSSSSSSSYSTPRGGKVVGSNNDRDCWSSDSVHGAVRHWKSSVDELLAAYPWAAGSQIMKKMEMGFQLLDKKFISQLRKCNRVRQDNLAAAGGCFSEVVREEKELTASCLQQHADDVSCEETTVMGGCVAHIPHEFAKVGLNGDGIGLRGTCAPACGSVKDRWSPEEHAVFLAVRKQQLQQLLLLEHSGKIGMRGQGKAGAGHCGKQQLIRAVADALPPGQHSQKLADVAAHEEWYQRHHFRSITRRAICQRWGSERDNLVRRFASILHEEEQLVMGGMRAREAVTSAQRDYLHQMSKVRVANFIGKRFVSLEQEAAEKAVERKKDLVRHAQEEEREENERCRAKEMIERHREDVTASLKVMDEERRQMMEVAAMAAKKAAAIGAERVEFRREREKERKQLAKAAEEKARLEREWREELMSRLRAKVAVHATQDPNRLLQPTESNKAEGWMGDKPPPRKLFPVHGYNMDELNRDSRFRVVCALMEAGLIQTASAKEAILGAQPFRPPRRDQVVSSVLVTSGGRQTECVGVTGGLLCSRAMASNTTAVEMEDTLLPGKTSSRPSHNVLVMEHVSPATRLLEKRRQMFEVQEALEAQKAEFARYT
ncbi:hypothetical protein CBR_g6397 [Chara braunii]|uniref:Uncharacterized protein n=1 Tax=Chara braunii TaxID=69332 RepID=A0A388KJV1_CHABU|nr:hypothetical protein CBR_g6397 [Chara braunii]|eukprot:GBG70268.1 hypothetical protein CBR_g6397 [Chara braunii]